MEMEEYFKKGRTYVWKETFSMVQAKQIDPRAFCNIVDKHEITVIIQEDKVDKQNVIETMDGWKIFTLGIVFPPTFCGVTARIATALGEQGISIMPISAYSRDHFLIHKDNLEKAVTVFESLGIKTEIEF